MSVILTKIYSYMIWAYDIIYECHTPHQRQYAHIWCHMLKSYMSIMSLVYDTHIWCHTNDSLLICAHICVLVISIYNHTYTLVIIYNTIMYRSCLSLQLYNNCKCTNSIYQDKCICKSKHMLCVFLFLFLFGVRVRGRASPTTINKQCLISRRHAYLGLHLTCRQRRAPGSLTVVPLLLECIWRTWRTYESTDGVGAKPLCRITTCSYWGLSPSNSSPTFSLQLTQKPNMWSTRVHDLVLKHYIICQRYCTYMCLTFPNDQKKVTLINTYLLVHWNSVVRSRCRRTATPWHVGPVG